MPAKSKAQQRFFGMVDAYKKGELDDASDAIKDAADGMSTKEVKKFARTKHKGLPNHVKKEKKNESFTLTMDDIRHMVLEVLDKTVPGFTNGQVRNMTGIYDDDELNASAESEEMENLGNDIAKSIMQDNGSTGRNIYSDIYDFNRVRNIIENQYGLKYVGPDEEDECQVFRGNGLDLYIYPKTWYPRLGNFKFANMQIMRTMN